MDHFTNTIVETSINSMFNGRYFSICTIDRCMEVLGVMKDTDIYPKLRLLHCVDFVDMPKEVYTNLSPMIRQLLTGGHTKTSKFELFENNPSPYKPRGYQEASWSTPRDVIDMESGKIVPFNKNHSNKMVPVKSRLQKVLHLIGVKS